MTQDYHEECGVTLFYPVLRQVDIWCRKTTMESEELLPPILSFVRWVFSDEGFTMENEELRRPFLRQAGTERQR